MEYVYYVMGILAVLLLGILLIMQSGRARLAADQAVLAERARKRRIRNARLRSAEDSQTLPEHEKILKRELSNVPTPWGWPGCSDLHPSKTRSAIADSEVHGVSQTLHRWVDRLVSERRTVEDNEYVLRKNASIRALLEDRYGRASTMPEIKYRKVKPLLLRDPSAPHDQMDNFPSGRVDKIEAKLHSQSQPSAALGGRNRRISFEPRRELKSPWGW